MTVCRRGAAEVKKSGAGFDVQAKGGVEVLCKFSLGRSFVETLSGGELFLCWSEELKRRDIAPWPPTDSLFLILHADPFRHTPLCTL
jgi:hypothetical protein